MSTEAISTSAKFYFGCKWLFWAQGFVLFAPIAWIKLPKLIAVKKIALIFHEAQHVEQCKRLSPMFLFRWWPIGWFRWWPVYIYYHIKYGYKYNPYEVEAVRAQIDKTIYRDKTILNIILERERYQ